MSVCVSMSARALNYMMRKILRAYFLVQCLIKHDELERNVPTRNVVDNMSSSSQF